MPSFYRSTITSSSRLSWFAVTALGRTRVTTSAKGFQRLTFVLRIGKLRGLKQQVIPLVDAADLEPDDVPGVAQASFMRAFFVIPRWARGAADSKNFLSSHHEELNEFLPRL